MRVGECVGSPTNLHTRITPYLVRVFGKCDGNCETRALEAHDMKFVVEGMAQGEELKMYNCWGMEILQAKIIKIIGQLKTNIFPQGPISAANDIVDLTELRHAILVDQAKQMKLGLKGDVSDYCLQIRHTRSTRILIDNIGHENT